MPNTFFTKHLNRLSALFIVGSTLASTTICHAATPATKTNQAVSVRLANGKRALLPIIVSTTASERVKAAAATLADYLQRISDAHFEVQSGDGKSGVAVGVASDFPQLTFATTLSATDTAQREDYILRSHATGVYLIGATEQAVELAVWDFLYRLGYRQFFPGEHWEVIPRTIELSTAVDAKEHPDYRARRIWFTYGSWPENGDRARQWSQRNRATGGIALNTGHSYGNIIARNKKEFDAHPEYFALIDGQRRPGPQAKLCLSNAGLRQLVVNHAIRTFAENPQADSISVDPSDGGHWCECEPCARMGSISDRVTILANEVAKAINERFAEKYGAKYVGFYAYNMHSPPPTVRVHPNVIVSIATAFVRGGFTVDQLMEGWQKQGATIGMREYYSIMAWDRDLPNRARASDPQYMARTIPHFHESGARFMSAESSDNWGPHGLSFYVAARLLWDVDEAKHVDEIVDDFLTKSFGTAKQPMTEFYRQLNRIAGAKLRPLSDDYVGRLYRHLDEAFKLTSDAAVQARLGDLALYVRYLELYLAYDSASGAERQQQLEALIRHVYRSHPTHMVHSLAIYRRKFGDTAVQIPQEAGWKTPEKDKTGKQLNPWKSSEPFSVAEVKEMVQGGIERNKLFSFEPVEFSSNLSPATKLNLPATAPLSLSLLRGTQDIYFWVDKPQVLSLQVSAGHLYANRGAAKLMLFAADDTGSTAVQADAADNEEEEPEAPPALAAQDVPPDAKDHTVSFQIPRAGLYRVQLADRMMGSRLSWPGGTPSVLRSALGATTGLRQRWKLYFYVPKGTRSVAGFAYGGGRILNADNKAVYNYEAKDGYFEVPVEKGQDGRVWSFESANGQIGLMTVPPYLARSAEELLLPREVIEADARN